MARAQTRLSGPLGSAPWSASGTAATTIEVAEFGSNPGRLGMFVHVPARPPVAGAPLIVLLHGCGQAAWVRRDTGWPGLTDMGFR